MLPRNLCNLLTISIILSACGIKLPVKQQVNCSVTKTDTGATIACPDGSTVDVKNGQDGAKGEKGDAGAQGEPGTSGIDGKAGEKGDPGLPGKDGQVGEKGDPGAQGIPGIQGQNGDSIFIMSIIPYSGVNCGSGVGNTVLFSDGSSLLVCDGSAGVQGISGMPGANGSDGTAGINGTSITISSIAPYSGAECPSGVGNTVTFSDTSNFVVCDGSKGETGIQGPPGDASAVVVTQYTLDTGCSSIGAGFYAKMNGQTAKLYKDLSCSALVTTLKSNGQLYWLNATMGVTFSDSTLTEIRFE